MNWSKWILVVDILTQVLLTLLTFIALLISRKVSIYGGWFLFGVSYYVTIQFITWRVINGKQYGEQDFSLNIFYWYSFASIQNSKSLAKNKTVNAWTSEFILKKKTLKISIVTFVILHFSHQNALTRLPLWVFRNLLFSMKPIRYAQRLFILGKKKPQRVC